MLAYREYAKLIDHQLYIQLPDDFDCEEVEVLILPKSQVVENVTNCNGLLEIGRIGYCSKSFVEDEEDYSQW